jgi:hypothetical protein
MTLTFECNKKHICDCDPWTGRLELVCRNSNSYEATVSARGSCFTIIVGSYQSGNYLCIPIKSVGCELADLSDTFWNRESIGAHLNPVDTESLVCAIKQLPKFDEVI